MTRCHVIAAVSCSSLWCRPLVEFNQYSLDQNKIQRVLASWEQRRTIMSRRPGADHDTVLKLLVVGDSGVHNYFSLNALAKPKGIAPHGAGTNLYLSYLVWNSLYGSDDVSLLQSGLHQRKDVHAPCPHPFFLGSWLLSEVSTTHLVTQASPCLHSRLCFIPACSIVKRYGSVWWLLSCAALSACTAAASVAVLLLINCFLRKFDILPINMAWHGDLFVCLFVCGGFVFLLTPF